MSQKAALFCHNGLGDGIVALVLSHNLYLNGFQVDTYQNALGPLQHLFPHLPILPYPNADQVESMFSRYDLLFVFQDTASEFIQKLIRKGKEKYRDRTKVLYIYPSKNIVNEPYYRDAQIDPSIPIAENLWRFCERILHLSKISHSNGIIPPPGLIPRRYENRIVIHPTSSRPGKNWPKQKFESLALQLQNRGYECIWSLSKKERESWPELEQKGFQLLDGTLSGLVSALYESCLFIGNDSGPGHLASSLGVPTVTIARRKSYCSFYVPCFTPGVLVTPNSLIPNIGGFRLRDRYWKHFISVRKVLRHALALEKTSRDLSQKA